eukprot:9115211-Lingulodinium_polyedra.AAC.1
MGFVKSSSESKWISGHDPLLQSSLHKDENDNMFIWNRKEAKKTWLDVLRREFCCWQLDINEPTVTKKTELWELKLPFEGSTMFFSLRHVFSWRGPASTGSEKSARIYNSFKWWRPALTAHGIEQSALRQGARSTKDAEGQQE